MKNHILYLHVFTEPRTGTYLGYTIIFDLMPPVIGDLAPDLVVSEWVQGMPTNISQEKDHIVLVEVFQTNCPGCFLHAIPEAINIYNHYASDGVRVLGVATAFEDFDKNTLENLKALAEDGTIIGETKKALSQFGNADGVLPFKIPFPLGMDKLTRTDGRVDDARVLAFIRSQIPGFDSESEVRQNDIIRRVKEYMLSKEYSAETFDTYALHGTPSTILVDRNGILRDVSFGQTGTVEQKIRALIKRD